MEEKRYEYRLTTYDGIASTDTNFSMRQAIDRHVCHGCGRQNVRIRQQAALPLPEHADEIGCIKVYEWCIECISCQRPATIQFFICMPTIHAGEKTSQEASAYASI